MKKSSDSKGVFENKLTVVLLAVSCAVAWGFAFPLIKLGIRDFNIDSSDTASKTLFAGIRFFFAGIIVMMTAKLLKMDTHIRGGKNIAIVLLFGFVNTTLNYFFYYIGLSNQSGSRSAVINSLSSFLLIIAACVFIKDEKPTLKKIIGCILGFGGILMVNLGGDFSSQFTFMGDGMLILSAVFSAAGGLLTRAAGKKGDPLVVTGIGLAFGGGIMIAGAIIAGGRLEVCSIHGIWMLFCLTMISVYGFSIYNRLLCKNPVGEIAIFNSLIPILGVLLSCVILKEPFKLQYIAAGIVVSAGILVINMPERKRS